jgi:oligoribonuclease NrnB/cAMP/cGMP phosphodiesterase (DHH superfamily)
MPKRGERIIEVISHGPSCLDGVMAAAAVHRFYQGLRVHLRLAANGESDRVIQELKPQTVGRCDEIWITDLSWTSPETAAHLNALARDGARIFWIDHHRTAVSRADAPEFKVAFTGCVLSEEYSAAKLTFNFLRQLARDSGEEGHLLSYERFQPFVELADDHDRWIHCVPGSADWALAVQTLGGIESYREIISLREPKMSRKLKAALEIGRGAMDKSLEVANATLVQRSLENGLRVRSACCIGYSSEVASKLYEGQTATIIALFDLRSLGVSLRRSADCAVDLSALAQHFGGGGHPAAAGFAIDELKRAPAERLAQLLGERLSGDERKTGREK